MYWLLNPTSKGTKKKKKSPGRRKNPTRKKSGSSSRRGSRTKTTSKPRRTTKKRGVSMAKAKTKRRRKRKVARRRKNPVRRRKAVRRRKPVRRRRRVRSYRKNPVRRRRRKTRRKAKRRYTRRRRKNPIRLRRRKSKAPKRRRSSGGGKYKLKLGNLMPNVKELTAVAMTGGSIFAGWAATGSVMHMLAPQVNKLLDSVGVVGEAGSSSRFIANRALDVVASFAVAGVVGGITGKKKLRDMMLLGGILRVTFLTLSWYLPTDAKPYVLWGGPDTSMCVGDWVTRSDVGALPAPGLGDFITRQNLGARGYAHY